MKLRTVLIASLVLASRLAAANPTPTTAEGWYTEGNKQYTLGNFDKAVEAFKSGFELETVEGNKASYLYNIAQSYRQANDCKNSVFFYKRFLALKANDTVKPLAADRKAEVDGWIKEGEACIKQQEDLRNKAPDGTVKPGEDGSKKPVDTTTTVKPVDTTSAKPVDQHVATVTPGDGGTSTTANNSGVIAAPDGPHKDILAVRLEGGATKVSAGDLSFPVQPTGTLLAGYPLAITPELTLELGAAFTFTPVPFDNMDTHASTTGNMFGLLANVGGRYKVAPQIFVRADVGAGVLVFSGLTDNGNPFTEGGVGASGALTMFHLRAAASVDYAINKSLAITLTPIGFSYSPAKSGFETGIGSFTSLDFMLGVGYRM